MHSAAEEVRQGTDSVHASISGQQYMHIPDFGSYSYGGQPVEDCSSNFIYQQPIYVYDYIEEFVDQVSPVAIVVNMALAYHLLGIQKLQIEERQHQFSSSFST